jgi:phosphate transport system permease protein
MPLFTIAESWGDVRTDWPAEPIHRYLPAEERGALDVFVALVYGDDPAEQPIEALVVMMAQHLSQGAMRQFLQEKPLTERTHAEVYEIVVSRILEPTIVETWSLYESLFHREAIVAQVAAIPQARLEFRRWVTWDFITSPQSSRPEFAGVRTAILGSLWVVFITILFSVPVGIGAAVYLEEYGSDSWFDRFIENNINNLAGVPSIIYGMLGLAVFVRALAPLTSGALWGANGATASGRTILSAGLTLGLLILPIIIINSREAIRAVPNAFREASYGLGATKWQTIRAHVLPNAIPGILTGSILAVSRAFGETAPLVVVGASTAIFVDPSGPFSKFTTLPIQIYQWTSRPQAAFQNLAAAAIIVLLVLLLAMNAVAIFLRNKYQRSY